MSLYSAGTHTQEQLLGCLNEQAFVFKKITKAIFNGDSCVTFDLERIERLNEVFGYDLNAVFPGKKIIYDNSTVTFFM
jgi:hypothetical protein